MGFFPPNTRKGSSPRLSVLVPVFNNAAYLATCLDSLLVQTLRDIEIILVNDGSTEEAAIRMLEDYRCRDARIRLINKPNTGYGHSLNVAMEEACGEYMGIVESDDFVHPAMYELLYKMASHADLDMVRCDFAYFIDFKGVRLWQRRSVTPDTRKAWIAYSCEAPSVDLFDIPVFNQPGIYKSAFIRANHIRFNESPGAAFQDNGFFFQIMMFARKFAFIDCCLYFLRRDNAKSSINTDEDIELIFREYSFIREVIEAHPAMKDKVLGGFHLRKFKSCLFNLHRLNPHYKESFLARFGDEFVKAHEAGELDISFFKTRELDLLQELLADRNGFFANGKGWPRQKYFKKQIEQLKHADARALAVAREKSMQKQKELFRIKQPVLRFSLASCLKWLRELSGLRS